MEGFANPRGRSALFFHAAPSTGQNVFGAGHHIARHALAIVGAAASAFDRIPVGSGRVCRDSYYTFFRTASLGYCSDFFLSGERGVGILWSLYLPP